MPKYICTLFTDSHAAGALVLWESVRQHAAGWRFLAFRIGFGNLPDTVPAEFRACCVNLSEGEVNPRGMFFWYEPFELCCALRGYLSRYMLERTDAEEWWVVDSDCMFMGSAEALIVCIGAATLGLVPHRKTPVAGGRNWEILLLYTGIYNGGVLGVRRTSVTSRFVDWFEDRLGWLAFDEPSIGLFVDQQWLGLASTLFPCATIEHPGVNIGHWNADERLADDCTTPVIIHFSQIDFTGARVEMKMASPVPGPHCGRFLAYAETYRKRLQYWSMVVGPLSVYPFSTFRDGRPITRIMRRAYYVAVIKGKAPKDPFAESRLFDDLEERGTMERFVNVVFPIGRTLGRRLFGQEPSLADVLNMYSEDDLFRQISGKVLLENLGQRLRRKIVTLVCGKKSCVS